MRLLSSTFCIPATEQHLSGRPDSLAALGYLIEIARQQELLLHRLLHPATTPSSSVPLETQELAFLDTVSTEPDLAEVARLAIALRLPAVRDRLWLRIDAGEPANWTLHVLPRLVGVYRAPALFLHAWSCWRAGHQTAATRALDYALAADSGYSAGKLLESAIKSGVHPDDVPLLSSGVSPSSIILQAVAR